MRDRQLMVYHFMTSWLHDFMFGAGWERDASHAPSGPTISAYKLHGLGFPWGSSFATGTFHTSWETVREALKAHRSQRSCCRRKTAGAFPPHGLQRGSPG